MSHWMFEMLPEGAFEPRPGGGMRLHGGKGGSQQMQAPDPALVAAQIKSMGIQDSAIEQMLNTSNEMLPLQKQQLQFGLDTSKAAYGQSQQDREYALQKRGQYDLAIQPLINESRDFNEEGRAAELYGKSSADIAQQADLARGQIQRQMDRRGVNPSDGMSFAMERQSAMDEALSKAMAGSKAREAATLEGRGLKTNLVNTLAGFPSQAAGLSASGAGYGAAGIGMANSSLTGMNSGYGSAAGAAGQMGSNATGMYGTQANAYLQEQNMNQNANNAIWGALGNVAGMGLFKFSDVNAKTNIRGMKPGAALEAVKAIDSGQSWEYKPDSDAADGGQTHVGPMAQDVNRVLGDEVAPGGKQIDLVSLNGLNMAATKELAEKVDHLSGVVSSLFKGGLRQGATHG